MTKPIFLIDTKEQKPYTFSKDITVWKVALKTGDYSVKGSEGKNGIIIERKSLNDFFMTMLKGRDRFRRELERMNHFAFKAVLVEASPTLIRKGTKWSVANGSLTLGLFLQDCMEFKVSPIFCNGRREGLALVKQILLTWHANKLKTYFNNKTKQRKSKDTTASRFRRNIRK